MTRAATNNFNQGRSRQVGRHAVRSKSQLHLDTLRVPNPFNDWVTAESVDVIALSVATGIRPYRIHALRTGLLQPHFHEAVVIERATAGGFPITAWARIPVVMAMIQRCQENAGVPMVKWTESRIGSGLFLQGRVRDVLETFCNEWNRLKAEEAAAGGTGPRPGVYGGPILPPHLDQHGDVMEVTTVTTVNP